MRSARCAAAGLILAAVTSPLLANAETLDGCGGEVSALSALGTTVTSLGPPVIVLKLGNIVHEDADAIVNAANERLMPGGGVSGAIYAAGGPALYRATQAIVRQRGGGFDEPVVPTGEAVITRGGALRAPWVIQAVGPIVRGPAPTSTDQALLASAYRNSVALAAGKRLRTVAFPAISTGIYGYPIEEAAPVALRAVLETAPSLGPGGEARFVLFDAASFAAFEEAASRTLPPGSWRIEGLQGQVH